MIQLTAIEVETGRREATAYLSLVKRDGALLGYRLIWVEKGERKNSKVTFVPHDMPLLEVIVRCYENPSELEVL